MEFHLVQNRDENYHRDHIPLNLKGNWNLFLWVHLCVSWRGWQRLVKQSSLSTSLVSLGIMGDQLRAPWNSRTSQQYRIEGFYLETPASRTAKMSFSTLQGTSFKWLLEKLIQLNRIWIVITVFWLIWHQTGFRFVLNQTEKCNYSLNLV